MKADNMGNKLISQTKIIIRAKKIALQKPDVIVLFSLKSKKSHFIFKNIRFFLFFSKKVRLFISTQMRSVTGQKNLMEMLLPPLMAMHLKLLESLCVN